MDVFCVRVLVLLLEAVQPRRWSWFVFALKTAASLFDSPVAMTSHARAHARIRVHEASKHARACACAYSAHLSSDLFPQFFLFARAAVLEKVIREGLSLKECA